MRNVDRLGENKMGLNFFERRILRKFYVGVEDGVCLRRYNYELYVLRKEPDTAVT